LALRGYIAGDSPLAGSVYKGPPMGVEVLVLALVMVLALVRLGVLWSRVPVTSGGRTTQQVAARGAAAWADIGLTLGGALYVGGLLGYAPLLASLEETPNR